MSGRRAGISERLDLRRRVDVRERTSHARRVPNQLALLSVPRLEPNRAPVANDNRAPRLDSHVDRAITAMRQEPARRWSLAALGRVAGLSRAPLARRFRRVTGTSPRRWLMAYRLELAQTSLLESDRPLAAIAAEVGYATDFALAKAFKRCLGIAPGTFRRLARRPEPTLCRAA